MDKYGYRQRFFGALCATLCTILLHGAALLMQAAPASAQGYPSKSVRIVVPVLAGGLQDAFARAMAQELSRTWAQPVIVDNRAGASGIIAAEIVVKSAPDGYTIFMTDNVTLMTNHLLRQNLSYDAFRDFAPVIGLVTAANVLLTLPEFPARNLQDLLVLARARPGQLTYGSYGIGSHNHVDTEALATQTGIKLTHVPYKGGAAIVQALLGGQISFSLTGLTPTLSLIRQGKVKALAFGGLRRSPTIPDVPTLSESGLKDFESTAWLGWLIPAGTPMPVIERIAADASRLLSAPGFRDRYIVGVALEVLNLPPGPFGELMKADRERFAERLKALNLKLE